MDQKTKTPLQTPKPPTVPPQTQSKKRKFDAPLPIEVAPGVVTPSFSPFLVISSSDPTKKLDSLSIFAISRALKTCGAGTPKAVNRYQSGSLMIQVTGRTECAKLMECTRFCDTPVTVETHRSLNRSKGVIKSRDLVGCSEDEMVAELEGVVEARRVSIRRGNDTIQTNTWILTFNSPKPPARLKIEYLDLEVRPYIPNPMRCYNCHRFGHTKQNCRRKAACSRCGKEDHTEDDCKTVPRCLNCQGAHAADSKECERWKEEKAILTYRATHGGTFAQAKAAVCPTWRTAAGKQSFADAVRTTNNRVSSSTVSVSKASDSTRNLKKKQNKSSVGTASASKNLFDVLSETGVVSQISATPVPSAVQPSQKTPPPSPSKSRKKKPLPSIISTAIPHGFGGGDAPPSPKTPPGPRARTPFPHPKMGVTSL